MNQKGGKYFVAEHLPEEMNESRRRANKLFSENKRKQPSHKMDMNFSKGRLFINEEQYTKSVYAPTVKDLIKPTEALFNRADEIDIIKGKTTKSNLSRFTSYAAAVESFEDIQAAFTKLRMKFADATHISCAYRLPGANTPQNQDYVDDGEFGCGRTMLKVLKDEQYTNMVVFIVRYYGGKHLGVARYKIFRELAAQAIKTLINTRKKEEENQRGPAVEPLPDRFDAPRDAFPTEPSWNELEDWSKSSKD